MLSAWRTAIPVSRGAAICRWNGQLERRSKTKGDGKEVPRWMTDDVAGARP